MHGGVLDMNRRAIALTIAILFVLSWVFPVVAGLVSSPISLPRWWGTVDVALAFMVALGAFGVQVLSQGNLNEEVERDAYQIYRVSQHATLFVAVLVMLGGDRIKWGSCATGFLWRTWLFLYILPWWLAAVAPAKTAEPMKTSISRIDH